MVTRSTKNIRSLAILQCWAYTGHSSWKAASDHEKGSLLSQVAALEICKSEGNSRVVASRKAAVCRGERPELLATSLLTASLKRALLSMRGAMLAAMSRRFRLVVVQKGGWNLRPSKLVKASMMARRHRRLLVGQSRATSQRRPKLQGQLSLPLISMVTIHR